MKLRMLVDFELATPPRGVLAGTTPKAAKAMIATAVLNTLAGLGCSVQRQGVYVYRPGPGIALAAEEQEEDDDE